MLRAALLILWVAAPSVAFAGGGMTSTSTCGDNLISIGEQCDPPDGDRCDDMCMLISRQCGDQILHVGEECDDGNQEDGDGCRANCTVEVCGDGIIDVPAEACDDRNNMDFDGCSRFCQREPPQDAPEADAGCTCDAVADRSRPMSASRLWISALVGLLVIRRGRRSLATR